MPCLYVDGKPVFESSNVAQYMDESHGSKMTPSDAYERSVVRYLSGRFDEKITGLLYRVLMEQDPTEVRTACAASSRTLPPPRIAQLWAEWSQPLLILIYTVSPSTCCRSLWAPGCSRFHTTTHLFLPPISANLLFPLPTRRTCHLDNTFVRLSSLNHTRRS